jgi:hypothetical protein
MILINGNVCFNLQSIYSSSKIAISSPFKSTQTMKTEAEESFEGKEETQKSREALNESPGVNGEDGKLEGTL